MFRFGRGGGNEESVTEASVEDFRLEFGRVLEVLLDEKAKNLSFIIDEASRIRVPTLRKMDVGHERMGGHQFSSASSGDSMTTYQRMLDRCDSSMMEREEMIQSLRAGQRHSRGAAENKAPAVQARRVESETNVDLPQAPVQRPVVKIPVMSMGTSSMMDPYTESASPSPITPYPLLSMPMISYDELQPRRELGRGQFACVNLMLWKGVQVALKEWHTLTDKESMDMACQEGSTLACLRHPCVVSFYGMLDHGPSPGLVVEYLPHLSLKSKLTEWRGTELDCKKLKVAVALRAARGMEFLHSRKVIHFDLKCENLLCDLRDLNDPIVKIGDVGLSKEKMKTFVSGNMRGTLPWMAPELFPSVDRMGSQGNITDLVNEKVDVYSFGVVLWEIWEMGEMPYPKLDPNQLLDGILKGTLSLECPRGCDPVWAEVMYDCLKRTPDHRPDFSTIIARLESLVDEDEPMAG